MYHWLSDYSLFYTGLTEIIHRLWGSHSAWVQIPTTCACEQHATILQTLLLDYKY